MNSKAAAPLKPARLREAKTSGEPGWSWRRAVIFPNMAVSFWMLYQLSNGLDTRVNETIAWGLIINILGSVFSYTGFATVQDIAAILATRSGLPYSPQSSPAEPTPGTPAAVSEE